MSHGITETDQMVYRNELPWHRLGIEFGGDPETLKKLVFNYDVELRPINVGDITIPGKYATWRNDFPNDDKGFLGIVGKDYTILQNSEMVDSFQELISKSELVFETAGTLWGGKQSWVLAKLPMECYLNVPHQSGFYQDQIVPYVLIKNDFTGGKSITVTLTPVRVVCNNTLLMSLNRNMNNINIIHTANLQERIKQAFEILNLKKSELKQFMIDTQSFAEHSITKEEAKTYFEEVMYVEPDGKISTRKNNNLILLNNLYQTGAGAEYSTGTLWGAYNAVTEYVDHFFAVRGKNQLERMNYTGAYKKQRAYEVALKMLS